MRKFTGDLTFLEIYEKNKWILNITVTDGKRQDNSILLNYLTAPNVLVWSAAMTSASIPGFFPESTLMAKTESGKIVPYYMSSSQDSFKFVDGSVACDLPLKRMSELFNINTFIVSQVNPHVAPWVSSDGHSNSKSRI